MPNNMQMELIQLKANSLLKIKFNELVHITTRFTGLKRSECLCGASELSVKKLDAWNQKVGHP